MDINIPPPMTQADLERAYEENLKYMMRERAGFAITTDGKVIDLEEKLRETKPMINSLDEWAVMEEGDTSVSNPTFENGDTTWETTNKIARAFEPESLPSSYPISSSKGWKKEPSGKNTSNSSPFIINPQQFADEFERRLSLLLKKKT